MKQELVDDIFQIGQKMYWVFINDRIEICNIEMDTITTIPYDAEMVKLLKSQISLD